MHASPKSLHLIYSLQLRDGVSKNWRHNLEDRRQAFDFIFIGDKDIAKQNAKLDVERDAATMHKGCMQSHDESRSAISIIIIILIILVFLVFNMGFFTTWGIKILIN